MFRGGSPSEMYLGPINSMERVMEQCERFCVEVHGPDLLQNRIALEPGATTIGRQGANDIVLTDEQISPEHPRLDCEGDVCTITDLGSTNGTVIDERG